MNSRRAYLANALIGLLPPTRCFGIKRALVRWMGAEVSPNVRISSSARFLASGRVSLGEDSWVGHEALFIGGEATIAIGARCDIGPRVTFVTGTHALELGSEQAAGSGRSGDIVVEDGCWIGAGATLLSDTIIGKGSMIAAGAVVRGEFPAGSLIGGVPAKILKSTPDE